MELTAHEDIEAPQDRVFAMMADFDTIERQAMRRGLDVTRTGDGPGAGMAWDVAFQFRGKRRAAPIASPIGWNLIASIGIFAFY